MAKLFSKMAMSFLILTHSDRVPVVPYPPQHLVQQLNLFIFIFSHSSKYSVFLL